VREPASLELARKVPTSTVYLRRLVEEISSIGSSPLGFRTTGTPEDRAVAELVAREMREIGLADVEIEHVGVDGWRFLGASLAVEGGASFEAASMGGVPPTPAGGVVAPLVDVGTAERRRLDRIAVEGRIALVDWTSSSVSPSEVGLELGLRGAIGMVLSCPAGGPYYQSDGALGSFDAYWHAGAPPMVTLRKEDVGELRRLSGTGSLPAVRLTLAAERTPGAIGHNVVGYLAGERASPPLVVGAHHDGWFRAAFDNASGVAAMLAVARALTQIGHRPRHRICFTSRTAEEYGLEDSAFDWCTGAWKQASETHPEWGATVPFHLCIEASGHPGLRLNLDTPPELVRFARAACRRGKAEGWLTSGWRVGSPVTGTEQWPLLISGIPGIAAYTWEPSFARTDYHTPRDTTGLLDLDHLDRLTRMYTLLLLEADRDPDRILDHAARGVEVTRLAETLGPAGEALAEAARRHRAARGRAAFTTVGRELLALDASGSPAYPHEQATRDLAALERAHDALAGGEHAAAARQLARVGDNALARRLSEDAFAIDRSRRQPGHPRVSWGANVHLTVSPNLWQELASLRGEPGARAPGAWIGRSIRGHIERTRADRDRRLAAMERALYDSSSADRRSTYSRKAPSVPSSRPGST
jgi:Peptidase family M28